MYEMYSMMTVVSTAMLHTGKLVGINPKTSHHKEKFFFSLPLIFFCI